MERYERIFNWVGWFGFLLLVPVGLHIFAFQPAVDFMQSRLGLIGNPSFLTLIAFILLLLRIIFGGGYIIIPLITGFITSFFLMFTVVDVSFMRWFRLFAREIFFLSNLHLNFLVAYGVLLTGVILSYFKKLSGKLQLVLLVIVPVLFLSVCALFALFQFPTPVQLSVDEGLKGLIQWIDEEYRDDPEVRQYVEEINYDRDLSIQQKEEKIRRMQEQIHKLEDELELFEEIRRENEKFREELERQKQDGGGFRWCYDSRGSAAQVDSFQAAVRPDVPCVRDFAVHLAKEYAGPYLMDPEQPWAPSESGIRQVCAIHRFLSANWGYISDPTIMRDDYFSPADRTIALGFAGDCDDFAILMSSCVAAVGGITRIVVGDCGDVGHAWCEVLVGRDEEDWKAAERVIRRFYRDRFMAVDGRVDPDGARWLSLDWRLGEYTCTGENREIVYEGLQRE